MRLTAEMGETKSKTVLGRIATAGREVHQARAMTLQKAMRVSLAKAADALMDLPLAVIGLVVQKVSSDKLEEIVADDALHLLLDGPSSRGGAVMIDPVLVGGFIQQQTIGTVRADTGATRAMTRTDAAICAPLFDDVFLRVPAIVDSADDARLIEGFRFGAKAEHARALLMALDAPDYTVIRLTVDLARGTRQGEIVVILPIPSVAEVLDNETEDVGSGHAVPPDMSKVVLHLTGELNMVLCKLRLPLTRVQSLKPGDILAIPPGHFPTVQICDTSGRVLGEGAVGHVEGVRAVKPNRAPLHASHPLRRASDEDQVDMPKVEEINDRRAASKLASQEAPVAIADQTETARTSEPETAAHISDDAPAPENPEHTPVAEQASTADLPELDDFPDLEDLPDLADLVDLSDLEDDKLSIAS